MPEVSARTVPTYVVKPNSSRNANTWRYAPIHTIGVATLAYALAISCAPAPGFAATVPVLALTTMAPIARTNPVTPEAAPSGASVSDFDAGLVAPIAVVEVISWMAMQGAPLQSERRRMHQSC